MAETELYYEVHGDGPPVVLIEGAGLDLRMWDDQVEPLAEHYRVIRYDARWIGRSPFTREPYQHHEDLYELLRQLGVDRAHLVGLSLGGRIALDLCLVHPEVVRSIVLSGPGLSGFEWSRDRDMLPMIEAIGASDLVGAADRWLEHPYMAPAMELPHLQERLRTLARENSHIYRKVLDPEIPLEPPAIDRLDEILTPTLLLVGTREVPDILAIADLISSRIANVRRIDFEGAGHVPNMEQPERFNQVVLDFLAEH